MDRIDLQRLAETRLKDAEVLLSAQCWSAAYYLVGYAVECGLKACASRQFGEHVVPEKKLVSDFYTHEIERLLNTSGVKTSKEFRAVADREFRLNWATVCAWNEQSRYDHAISETMARDMYAAVAEPASGVLSWLKMVW